MAQISTSLYKTIADSYASIDINLSGVATDARTALDAIVDVDTATYFGESPSNADADAALEIELVLLTPFNVAYVSSQNISVSVSALLDAVRSVNNHVVNNTSGADTSAVKLTSWINNQMNQSWTNDCPIGWANLSSDAGYDTSAWVTTAV